MILNFYKYHGTGNDFIMIDGFKNKDLTLTEEKIKRLCDRRFGVGADGLIILKEHKDYDFEMVYYNADGRESSMCGNGGRCIVKFAHRLGYVKDECSFLAIDGLHEGKVVDDKVSIKMSDVSEWECQDNVVVVNTGSPHFVRFVEDLDTYNILEEGRRIRYSETYKIEGINVNLAEIHSSNIAVMTYERGVEDETYSCGTGVVATVLAQHIMNPTGPTSQTVQTKGGELSVRFSSPQNGYRDIWLTGPAIEVYTGKLEV